MKTVLDRQIEDSVLKMCLCLGAIIGDLGVTYITCYGAVFDSMAILISVSWTAMLLTALLYQAFRYTDLRLLRFERQPMPAREMISQQPDPETDWEVDDIVITSVFDEDEDQQ